MKYNLLVNGKTMVQGDNKKEVSGYASAFKNSTVFLYDTEKETVEILQKEETMTNAVYHHTSLCRGYVRINEHIKEPYIGRFGKGYTVKYNNPNSTRYCYKDYYVL